MKVLVTGANGQLGRCLIDRLQSNSGFEFVALDKSGLDIGDPVQVDNILNEVNPDVVINAAAYTAVDRAEEEPELARRVNAQGAENLARSAARLDIALIHVSTDYVFDGEGSHPDDEKRSHPDDKKRSHPYKESDITRPAGVYGQTKLAGEKAVSGYCPKHIILRTAWVYSEYGNNFVKTMLRLAGTRDELNVVADQLGCPTYAGDIADTILKICPGLSDNPPWGIYHYAGATRCSWAEFARAVFAEARNQGIVQKEVLVHDIPSSEYPTPAKRPKYSVLDCEKISANFDVMPVPLAQSLPKVLASLVSQQDKL